MWSLSISDPLTPSVLVIYASSSEFSSNSFTANFAVPPGDLGGGNWVHLVGTCDGANWRLYRNGTEVASAAAPGGAPPVDNADWAVGSTGNGWADNFAGAIDEVALYSTALSSAQIANHYLAATAGPTPFAITKSGDNVTITWPAGATLQEAATVSGPFSDLQDSPVSPLTLPATGTRFYRWKR